MKKFIYLFALILIITSIFSFNSKKVFAADCVIESDGTGFIPSGKQDSGWFTDAKPPSVDIVVKTTNCANKNITLTIYKKTIIFSDTALITENIVVPNSGIFSAHFTAGTKDCLIGGDCNQYLEIKTDTKTFTFKEKTLVFGCDSGCTKNKNPWVVSSPVSEISSTPMVLGTCGDGIDNDNDKLIDEKDPDCLDSGVGFSPPFYMTTNFESGRYTKLDEVVAAIEARKKIDDAKNNNISDKSSGYGISPQSIKEDNTYHLLAPIPGMKADFIDGSQQIGDYINSMFKIFLGLCAALAVIMIIIYGVTWMGTDSVFGKTEAKSKIGGAIGGLLLALGAWVILNTINPDLLGGTSNIKQASIELEGDSDSPVSINSGDASKIGLICDHTGGMNNVPTTARSFNGKMTYSQEIPKGQVVNNKIKLDCSGYVNYVLQCVGINTTSLGINSGTYTIFSNAEKVDTTKTTATSINGIDLKVGDLVGWKKGDNTEAKYKNSGHVMIYMGGGLVSDSHSGDSNAFGSFTLTRYKDQIKFVKRL